MVRPIATDARIADGLAAVDLAERRAKLAAVSDLVDQRRIREDRGALNAARSVVEVRHQDAAAGGPALDRLRNSAVRAAAACAGRRLDHATAAIIDAEAGHLRRVGH